MREGLHPNYAETTITCACGNVMKVGSTKQEMKVDVCSKCHPYWTGNLKEKQQVVEQINSRKNMVLHNLNMNKKCKKLQYIHIGVFLLYEKKKSDD